MSDELIEKKPTMYFVDGIMYFTNQYSYRGLASKTLAAANLEESNGHMGENLLKFQSRLSSVSDLRDYIL